MAILILQVSGWPVMMHQAIYSFTGASVGNILNFQSMFPGSRQFILDLNYRSRPKSCVPAKT
jgi:hypothetical protein